MDFIDPGMVSRTM